MLGVFELFSATVTSQKLVQLDRDLYNMKDESVVSNKFQTTIQTGSLNEYPKSQLFNVASSNYGTDTNYITRQTYFNISFFFNNF